MSVIMLKNKIKELSFRFKDEIITYRRHFHQYPELSFKEFETSKFIINKLTEWEIPFQKGFVKTGIVATLKGKKISKTQKVIALRSDMDALPIQEENQVSYISKKENVMHACGHDVHIACLLGVIKILKQLENEFSGIVYFIFQPAEELLPGGAKLMLKEKLFEKEPEIILAQHISPFIEVGKIGLRANQYMASCDEIFIHVKGEGGHGGMPEKTVDTVLISAHIIIALQQIISRNKLADLPAVLSFGKVETGGAMNIIPKLVKIEGTLRTMNEDWRAEAKIKITKMAKAIAEGMGANAEVNIIDGYPFLKNDEFFLKKVKNLAKNFLGEDKIEDLAISMTCEDFAYFSQKYPSVFYRLGTKNKNDKEIKKQHTSTFNIDENAIETGISAMSYFALSLLS